MIDFTNWTLKKLWLFWLGVIYVPLAILLLIANRLYIGRWAYGNFWGQIALLVPLCLFLALIPALKISLKMNAKRWREEEDAKEAAEAAEAAEGEEGEEPEVGDGDDAPVEETAATEEVAAEAPVEEPEAAPAAAEPDAAPAAEEEPKI